MNRAPRRMRAMAVFAALVALGIAGCRPEEPARPEPLVSNAERGPVRFQVAVEPASVHVGDTIRVAVEVRAPADTRVQLPRPEDFGPNLRSLKEDPPVSAKVLDPQAGDENVWRQRAELDAFESGALEIPPLVLRYDRHATTASPTEFTHELATNTLKVEVRSALTPEDSPVRPRDITGAMALPPEPWTWREWLWLGAAILGVGAIGWLITRWFRARRSRGVPPDPADVWALRELDLLTDRLPQSPTDARPVYYALSGILRRYIELQFGLHAPEMTTQEFLQALAGRADRWTPVGSRGQRARRSQALRTPPPVNPIARSILEGHIEELRAFLVACDLIKYAGAPAGRDEILAATDRARHFVRESAAALAAARTAPAVAAPQEQAA